MTKRPSYHDLLRPENDHSMHDLDAYRALHKPGTAMEYYPAGEYVMTHPLDPSNSEARDTPQHIIDAAEEEVRDLNDISHAAWPLAMDHYQDDIDEAIGRLWAEWKDNQACAKFDHQRDLEKDSRP